MDLIMFCNHLLMILLCARVCFVTAWNESDTQLRKKGEYIILQNKYLENMFVDIVDFMWLQKIV